MSALPLLEVLPALPLLLYVAGGAVSFLLFGARRYRDEEIARRSSGASTRTMRLFFSWLMAPWLRLLVWAEIPANAVTSLSLSFSLAAAIALAAGHFALGGVLFVIASVCDYLDGRLARHQGGGTTVGAALDSIVDRYSEVALLTGLAWYYRDTWILAAALFALSGSLLVPYVRAKAEALGEKLETVGVLQRPERAAILALTTGLAPFVDSLLGNWSERLPVHSLTVAGICILAVGTQWTAAQRTHRLLRALSISNTIPRSSGPRAILSSVVATGADAATVALVVSLSRVSLPWATAFGCLVGACVNFTLNRTWAFRARGGALPLQIRRYVIASSTSAVLSAGGVAVLGMLPTVPDPVAWLVVRGVVFLTWTFPLFRTYVFPSAPRDARADRRRDDSNAPSNSHPNQAHA